MKKEEREQIVKLFKEGVSKKKIASSLSHGYVNTCRILKEEGFGQEALMRQKHSILSEAYEYYQNHGITLENVGEKHGLSYQEVRSMFLKNSMKLKKTGTSALILNENYFEVIDNPNKAYLLGFLNCDGSIFKRGINSKGVSLEVKEEDRYLVEFLLTQLGISHEYIRRHKRENSTTVIVQINSRKIFDDLTDKGIEPSKMGNKQIPNKVPLEYYPSLILGMFDADGSLKGEDLFSVSGGGTMCYDISDFLYKNLTLSKKPRVSLEKPRKDKPHWNSIPRLVAGKKDSKLIFSYLHKEDYFCLSRKLPTYMRNN